MKAVALICSRCGGRLLVAPGVGIGVCNPCSAACDFSTGEKKSLPVEEPILDPPPGGEPIVRLPFIRFSASAAGERVNVYVMAFALRKIGTPHDDGSKLTVDEIDAPMRPGRADIPPEIAVATAAALARFLALRRIDPDGRKDLRPAAVRLADPTVVVIPYVDRGDRLFNPVTGVAQDRSEVLATPAGSSSRP